MQHVHRIHQKLEQIESWGGGYNFEWAAYKHQLTNVPLTFMVLIVKPAIDPYPPPPNNIQWLVGIIETGSENNNLTSSVSKETAASRD